MSAGLAATRVRSARVASLAQRWPIVLAYGILAVVVVVTVLADVIAPYGPNQQDLDAILLPSSSSHLLGTDDLGRDVLSRVIVGTRTSVLAAALAVLVALVIGLPLGLLAGWKGGWIDSVIMRVIDALLAFPAIVLAIAITATLGAGITNAMVAVGIVLAPVFCRLSRAQVLSVKQETYIEAAMSFGARGFRRMILPHVLPNSIQPVLVQLSVLAGYALIAEATLSFLQLGVQPPDPSWGTVLARAYNFMDQAPLQIFVPGVAIAVTVFSLNIIGDDLQRRLDPRRRHS